MATAQPAAPPRRGSGMRVDWNKVPDTASLISGTYNVRIEKMWEATTGNNKACWKVSLKVLPHDATKRMTNKVHQNTFVIGNDEDPMARDQDTVNDAIGTQMMKKMFKAAGVKLESEIRFSARASIGKSLTIVGVLPDKPGPNQTRAFFNVNEWLPLGKREPMIDVKTAANGGDEETVSGNGRPRRAAPTAAPADEPEDEAAAEVEADAEADTGTEVAEPGDEPEEQEAAEEEPEPPKKAAAAKGVKEATVVCGMCEKPIARSKYAAHVQTCG